MSVYSWGMRSPYGRIFAQPEQPDTTAQARHGDIWIGPLGMYYFSRSGAQVGNPGTGTWVSVVQQQAVPPIAVDVAPAATAAAGAGNQVLSGTIAMTADGTYTNPGTTTFLVSGLNSRIIAATPVTANLISTDGAVTSVTGVGSAGGTITFTLVGPVGLLLANNGTLTFSFTAYPV